MKFNYKKKPITSTTDRRPGTDPVELRPGHGHVAVVVGVVAGAAERLLSQEDQVLLGQAPAALHLRLVLHVDGVAQLRPEHVIRHEERHPSLQTAEETGFTPGFIDHSRRRGTQGRSNG